MHIILDSCIVEYYLHKELSFQIKDIFDNWGVGFDFAVSQIVYSELVDGAYPKKERIIIKTLKSFYNLPVTERNIIGSGKLGSVYREFNITQGISITDKIIAATSIITNSLIVTANINDYPQPFFEPLKSSYIKKSKQTIKICLLKPDYLSLRDAFNYRELPQ